MFIHNKGIISGSRTIAPEENPPPTLNLILTLIETLTLTGGQFSLGAIAWAPSFPIDYIKNTALDLFRRFLITENGKCGFFDQGGKLGGNTKREKPENFPVTYNTNPTTFSLILRTKFHIFSGP